ncbi:MAG: XdhC family protein [Alphaproteobacteria bacterium]|nr:XdhC family protein [Alphaproteobacteria bacterium]
MKATEFPPGLASDLDVLAFAAEELASGRPAALVTIIGLDGPFSRPVGAQIAVARDRRFVGSISGGCLEAALTEEARSAMGEGNNRTLRYGRGSPYIDVRLPCGGGIDLAVDVNLNAGVLAQAITIGQARKPFALAFDPASKRASLRLVENADTASQGFVRQFRPRLRIVLAGRGWEIVAMARLARSSDCEIVVASQEPATLDYCRPFSDQLIELTTPNALPPIPFDKDTAVACLFHEHEWETSLLLGALRSDAYYVGALGSRQTHERRLDSLMQAGASPNEIARLKGPLGLFPSRDPKTLAVSALAEILSLRSGQTAS